MERQPGVLTNGKRDNYLTWCMYEMKIFVLYHHYNIIPLYHSTLNDVILSSEVKSIVPGFVVTMPT